MADARVFPVILAGGASSRLWPASGQERPKWALRIAGAHGGQALSLMEGTFARARAVAPAGDCFVVTAQSQADLVRSVLPELPAANVLVEPSARDTSGAVAYTAGVIRQRLAAAPSGGATPLMLVLPGDQVIHPVSRFAECVAAGARAACQHRALVTMGIVPASPATGYGYIHRGDALAGHSERPAVYRVLEFREKPDRQTAETYVSSGDYFWNAGIFIWTLDVLLNLNGSCLRMRRWRARWPWRPGRRTPG